ncbi:MAG: S-layer homology domain-containing protein, partial [Clostridia bacterium]|nr:S-layer homology domain-containing protein [Clostridia bacterium]
NQTTVTVLDKENKPVKGISVTVKDAATEKTAATNANGQITVPVKTSSGGSSSGGSSGGGGGGSYISSSTVNVKITDKNGKSVTGFSKSTDSKGNITVTLPTGKVVDEDNYYTITVTDNKGNAKADTSVTLKDKKNGTATGITDKNGVLTLPATEHKAYIFGYEDGTFRPNGDMTRAEAAAIFARLIAEEKGENISSRASFDDVAANEWYSAYIGYLEKYSIIKGYADGAFKSNTPVTRAEFVAMTVRYYSLFNEVKKSGLTVKYTDVSSSYWAYADIAYTKETGWLNGYSDGSFRGDNNISRAEVVTVVNRATNRMPDKEYINRNFTKLNRFTDLKDNSFWAFYDAIESCNDHKAVTNSDGESWVD